MRIIGASLTASLDVIQNNSSFGIRAFNNSRLRIGDMTITGNGSNGIQVESASAISFNDGTATTISGNKGYGMLLLDQTNVAFDERNTIGGNTGQPDLNCAGIYWVATGVNGIGGTTNCNHGNQQK